MAKCTIRIADDLHERIAELATIERVSLNTQFVRALAHWAQLTGRERKIALAQLPPSSGR